MKYANLDERLLCRKMLIVFVLTLFASHKVLSSVVTITPPDSLELTTATGDEGDNEEGGGGDGGDESGKTGKWLAQLEEAHRDVYAVKPISAGTGSYFVWSAWEPWITCSRSCGGGVSYQLRGCLRGQCKGPAIQYKTCNTQDCPPDSTDFRAQQCSAYNDVPYRDNKYEWEPVQKLPFSSQCTLTCQAKGHDIRQVFSPKVLDGTRCSPNAKDMCINGKCEPVGCDYQLNTTAVLDTCRVCRGDNSTCKLIKGNNLVPARPGLNDVHEIPTGSHSIRITNKDPSYLGVREKDGPHGFNQQLATALNQGNYTVGGVSVMYTRLRNGREHVDIEEPIQEPVMVTLLIPNIYTTRRYKFHYQYIAPLENMWKTVGWNQCTASCGGGEETSVIVCVKVASGRPVPDSYCEGRRPDYEMRTCNEIICPPSWAPDPWEPCSRSCGGGIQTRRVFCVQRAPGGLLMRISDMMCSGTRQPSQQACNVEMCPHWFPGPWTLCPVTCGRGVITREVQCQDNSGLLADGCDPEERPIHARECIVGIPCIRQPEIIPELTRPHPYNPAQPLERDGLHTPSWSAGEWGACSVTCGHGLRRREAECKVFIEAWNSIQELPVVECEGQDKPAEYEECDEPACDRQSNVVKGDYSSTQDPDYSSSGPLPFKWRYGSYTQCSASCIGGFHESIVECVSIFDDSPVSDAFCKIEKRLPIVRKVCNEIPCPPEWMIPLYGECSASCGGGFQLPQVVMCMEVRAKGAGNTHVLSDDSCDGPKPSDPVPCNRVDCPAYWMVRPWSQCSVSCDNGTITRSVKCLQLQGTEEEVQVDPLMCPQPAPSSQEMCMQGKCRKPAKWRPQEWSECSATCGQAFRVRTIMCLDETDNGSSTLLDFRNCPADSRPNDMESCALPKCSDPVILANQTIIHQQQLASKMRLSVGTEAYLFQGTTITVKCPVQNFKKSEVVWQRGQSPLPTNNRRVKVVKGGTLRIRHVMREDSGVYACIAGSARETFTLHISEQRVFSQHIGDSWSVGPWSECSASCGGGTQTREVNCEKTTADGQIKPNISPWKCKENQPQQPGSMRDCNTQLCETHWSIGPWSECGGASDCIGPFESTQTRVVKCESAGAKELPIEECKDMVQPETKQSCQSEACRPTWQALEWTMCTSTCGLQAARTRKIQCIFKGTQTIADKKWCNVFQQPSVVQTCNLLPCPGVTCEDQSQICPLIKRFNMCHLPAYQEECCNSCSGNG